MTPRGVMTDGNGRYSAEVPAKSRVFATVWERRQPCVANASVDQDTTLDVQLFPAGKLSRRWELHPRHQPTGDAETHRFEIIRV